MIEIKNLCKKFDNTAALDGISFTIQAGSIFGLVGSNGAGKSTLLRTLSGVYQPTSGEVYLNGAEPYDNTQLKNKIAYISDYPYFFSQATLDKMASFYRKIYPRWSEDRYRSYLKVFPISNRQKINTMSKGMQRQAALILCLSTTPEFIFFDEIFDGLDPVIRELLKQILIEFVTESNATILIASHNLRELEDLCDHVGLLHRGGVICEKDLDELKLGIFRIQAVFSSPTNFEDLKQKIDIVRHTSKGALVEFTAKNQREEIIAEIEKLNPVFYEILPLTLEEIFISEMEVAGYDIDNIIKK